MNITTSITLNMQTPGYVVAYEPQGNKLSRFITATLKDGSASWSVPSGATAMIRVAKPDGTFAVYDKNEKGQTAYTISGSTVTIELVGAALAAAGDALVTVMFLDSTGSNLSPFSFRLVIMPSAVSDDDIASSDYFNVFQDTINKLQAFYGAPLTAATASAMTDTTRVYVYVGSESGYVYGHWYYYNGSTWVNGGVYNSEGINSNWLYAAYPTETISNVALANFSDGADNVPVKALSIAINPVQSMHGYDNPWPGGGGKNKLENTAATVTKQGLTYTVNADGTVTVNGTATANSYLAIACSLTFDVPSIVSGTPTPIKSGVYIAAVAGGSNYNDTTGDGVTIPANTEITAVRMRIDNGVTVSNVVFQPMVRLASETDATYAPYSNICPISGWDSAEVTRTGSNLVSPSDVVQGSLDGGGWNTSSTNRLRTQFIAVEPNTVYSATIDNGIQIYCVYEYRENQGYIKYTTINASTVTFTTSNTTAYVKLLFRFANNATITPQDVKGIQLCEGNTTSLLTVTVTWADSAGTVYGGILTNNGNGTWTLEVHWFGLCFDTAEKIALLSTYTDRRLEIRESSLMSYIPYPRIKSASTQLCSHATYQSNAGTIHQDTIAEAQFQIYPTNGRIYFAIPGVDSLQGYKDFATAQMTAGTPLTFVALVAESQYATYQLTGPEVLTLLGVNNIWSDTGDIEELAYRADIGLYLVDALNPIKEMLANREDTMKATRAYSAGDYIVVGNTFYRAAVPIANGATLTPGTNVIKTTVGDQLKALS